MTIIFYSMPGCGHCINAMSELKKEIENNTIIMKHSSTAPNGVMGFPYFTNGNKSITGYPGSKQKLFEVLGYVGGRLKNQKKIISNKKLNNINIVNPLNFLSTANNMSINSSKFFLNNINTSSFV